jgi:predicted DCC family thiol-disulfide oxidoreductase YuxK
MDAATKDPVTPHAVVVFDGECSFCNGWIDFLLRFDKKDIFRFSARQSEAGAAFALQSGIPPGGAGSIIVVEDQRIRLRSDAVLRMLSLLGFPFSLLGILRLVPAALRDAVYDLIARNRKRWFGKTVQCRIPAPSERRRFL